MKSDLQYVYKYVDDTSRVVYVGITNDIQNRVRQHKHDKLRAVKNPIIYYFPVKYRADADMLETYLINHYGTGKYYNVSKTQKGDFSFFDICDDLPWHRYSSKVDEQLKPFIVSDLIEKGKEVVVEKKVFVNKDSIDAILQQYDASVSLEKAMLDDLISFENDVTSWMQSIPNYKNYPTITKGLQLHKKRLICARVLKHYPWSLFTDSSKRNWLLSVMERTKIKIENYEKTVEAQND